MKATIKGIEVQGTPKEIAALYEAMNPILTMSYSSTTPKHLMDYFTPWDTTNEFARRIHEEELKKKGL